MTPARFSDRLLGPAERLVSALTDPARRERTVIGVLAAYVLIWTVYAVIAKASQGVHFDMAESFALWHEPGFGYEKHPPFAAIVSGLWFSVFPVADWSFYLLSMSVVGVALWIIWKLCGDYLDSEKRVVALALLMLVPFFNFHALKYNNNTILIPLWAATTLFFLRSFENRRVLDAALAGVAAAGAMYGKYWSVMLLAGLGIAALMDRRRMDYFRSAAPWVTIAAGALLLAPNVYLVVASNFAPMEYAYGIHGARSMAKTVASAGGYLASSLGYVAVALVVAFIATRPSRAAVTDSVWPSDDRRRLAVVAFWAALLVPVPFAIAAHLELTGLWSMASWSLLPVLLLSSPLVTLPRLDAVRVTGFALLFPIIMVIAAPAIAFFTHRAGGTPSMLHSSLLAPAVDKLWRETTPKPLRMFSGFVDFAYGVAFYLPSHPPVVHILDGVPARDFDARLARDGIALVCPAEEKDCVSKIDALVARVPGSKRETVEVARMFMGTPSASGRYVIAAIPPRQ
jgi:4-amino-4-deoxy-L-arabinose transferase-like glycosyltransferase